MNTLPEAAPTGATAKRSRKAKPARAAAPAQAGGKKESRGESIIHELFRLAKVDLRSSEHGKKLASELAGLMGGNR